MIYSNFGGVCGRVLRRARVHVRIRPAKVTTCQAMMVMALSILGSVVVVCAGSRRVASDLPAVLRGRVAPEQRVDPLAQLACPNWAMVLS